MLDALGVLTLATALLQREKRLSARMLKRIFDLDDAGLEDLKFELVHVRRLAVDVDGILHWVDETHGVSEEAYRAEPPTAPRVAEISAPASAGGETASSQGERRHLTVMFCDLVGSTELSTRFDPEDLQEIIRGFQDLCAGVVSQFDGYVAKYMGDGVLIYFGYPQAHENDAERAVRTALALVEAMPGLASGLEQDQPVELAARVGIDTGLVVVGEVIGEGGAEEVTVVGETPNVAARLQGLAEPNAIVLGAVTYELAGRGFAYEDLGVHRLKGIAEPVQAWRVLGLSEAEDDLEGSVPGAEFLVGRDEEIGLLMRRWEQSKDGHGQAVLISGEPGIGKSTLVETVSAHVRRDGYTRIAFRCSPYHTNSALYPLVEHIRKLVRWEPEDSTEIRLEKLEESLSTYSLPLDDAVRLIASLMSLPLPEGRYAPLNLTPQQQKQQTIDALVALMLEEAERNPVLAVWEDLHWADPSTLELLGLLIDQVPTGSLLIALTFRPDFVPAWPMRSHMTPITLNRLERPQIEVLVARLAGKTLPAEVVEHIVIKTDGVPLYVEELTKMILESDLLREEAERYILTGPLSSVTIPTTLQESLMARLDRAPTVREVAQLGAVLGREFAYDVLNALAVVEERALQDGLRQLVESELLYQRGRPPQARYIFKHALVQDAAYQSLLRRTRQKHHLRVAELLTEQFPEAIETQPELIAHHYTEAGNAEQAVEHWYRAGQQAARRFANPEAIGHLVKGLEVLRTLSESPERDHRELNLQITLGPALMATKGYGAPEVVAAYGRARALCQDVGDTKEMFPVLWGLWLFYVVRAEHETALDLADQLVELAGAIEDDAFVLEAQLARGASLLFMGDPIQARDCLERCVNLYDPQRHRVLSLSYAGLDPGVVAAAYAAWALWLLGYPDQALKAADTAQTWAKTVHPYTQARSLFWDSVLRYFVGEWETVLARADTAIAMAKEQDYALVLAVGSIMRGWALTEQGRTKEGVAVTNQGLEAYRATGSKFQLSLLLIALAEAAKPDDGLATIADAIALVETTGERFYEAELLRLQGEKLLASSSENGAEAEACFVGALEVAGRQHAKSLELRAAMSLARLWQQQGRDSEAGALLKEVYDWFSEGFETEDLKQARSLLEGLRVAA